jgi:hypothetical protein
VYALFKEATICKDTFNFKTDSSNVFYNCQRLSCNDGSASLCGKDSINNTCNKALAIAQSNTPAPTPIPNSCADKNLPTFTELDLMGCAKDQDALGELYARRNACDEERCSCQHGVSFEEGNFVTCENGTEDCGTMNCTIERLACRIEMFMPYTLNKSDACVGLLKAFLGFDTAMCRSMFCSYSTTSTCTTAGMDNACENVRQLSEGINTYFNPKGDAVRMTTKLTAVALNADEQIKMKEDASAILNLDDNSFALIFAKDFEFTIVVYDSIPLVSTNPVILTTAGITQALEGNQGFMDTWVNRIEPSRTPSPAPSVEPTPPPTPNGTSGPTRSPSPSLGPAPQWCLDLPSQLHMAFTDPAEIACTKNSTLWEAHRASIRACFDQRQTCTEDCKTWGTCYTNTVKCIFNASRTLLRSGYEGCTDIYTMETDDDVVYHRCMHHVCNHTMRDCGENAAIAQCQMVADASEGFCRKETNTICKKESPYTDVEPLVDSNDFVVQMDMCMRSTGRIVNVSSCYQEACECESGTFVNNKCKNGISHCGTLNCSRDLLVCLAEKYAPFLTYHSEECGIAMHSWWRYSEDDCEREACDDEDDRYCTTDDINELCDVMSNIFVRGAVLKADRLSGFALSEDDVDNMRNAISLIINVDSENIAIFLIEDDNVSVNVIDRVRRNSSLPAITDPKAIEAALLGDQQFVATWLHASRPASWCARQPPAKADDDVCLLNVSSPAYQQSILDCETNVCTCMGSPNTTECGLRLEGCWETLPKCFLERQKCVSAVYEKYLKNNAVCQGSYDDLVLNKTNIFLECVEQSCDDQEWRFDCTEGNHIDACRYAAGLSTNPSFTKPSLPLPPKPTMKNGEDTQPQPQDIADAENVLKACVANNRGQRVFWELMNVMGNCTNEYETCLLDATTVSDDCPQENVLNLEEGRDCFEDKYQCFYQSAAPFLSVMNCPKATVTTYMSGKMQYDDCMNTLINDDDLEDLSDAQRKDSCEEIRDLANMYNNEKDHVELQTNGNVASWTPQRLAQLQRDISIAFNIKEEDVAVFVRPYNGTVDIVLKNNPEKRNPTQSIITDLTAIASAIGKNTSMMQTYGIQSAPKVTDATVTPAPSSPSSDNGPNVGLIVGVVIGGITVIVVIGLILRRRSQNYIITDQEMLMHNEVDYRNV